MSAQSLYAEQGLKAWEKHADRKLLPESGKFFRVAKGPGMRAVKFKFAAVLGMVLLGSYLSFGQHANAAASAAGSGRAQGSLTVTLTLVSSVGVVTEADGRQRVVVANAAAPTDNVSSLQYVRLTDVNASGNPASANGDATRKTRKKQGDYR
jgi:hypothetical protein